MYHLKKFDLVTVTAGPKEFFEKVGMVKWCGVTRHKSLRALVVFPGGHRKWFHPNGLVKNPEPSDEPTKQLKARLQNAILDEDAEHILTSPLEDPILLVEHSWESEASIGIPVKILTPDGVVYHKRMIFISKKLITKTDQGYRVQPWYLKKLINNLQKFIQSKKEVKEKDLRGYVVSGLRADNTPVLLVAESKRNGRTET